MSLSKGPLAFVVAAIVVAAALPVRAGAELQLTDGRTLRGTSVELHDDTYTLRTETGSVVTVPSALVRELRLIDDEKPAPTAFRTTEGEVVAGPPRPTKPPKTEDQVRKLGPSANFRPDPVKSVLPDLRYWYPDPAQQNFAPSSWSKGVFDPIWTPRSAYDARKDVLAPGRSRWARTTFDATWWPVDGFTKESPGDAPERKAADAAPRPAPDEQVERTRRATDAATRLQRGSREAVAGVFGEVVRAARRADPGAPPPVLLRARSDLERITAAGTGTCPLTRSRRDTEAAKAAKAFAEPRVDDRGGADVVRFLTWSARGGVVVRHVAVEDDQGRFTLEDEPVAEHVGIHDEPSSR